MRILLTLIMSGLCVSVFASASSAPVSATVINKSASATLAKSSSTTGLIVNIKPCLPDSPCGVVKQTSSDVMVTVNQSYSPDKTVELIKAIAVPQFDFNLMTRYALGNNWKSATPSQQAKLVGLFRELLVFTYSTALSKFKNAQITLTDETINPINPTTNRSTASVISQVVLPNSSGNMQPVKVEYDLVRHNNQPWKAYDIKIENASLVTTYRNQFNDVVQSSKIDGLIQQLESKVASLKAKGA